MKLKVITRDRNGCLVNKGKGMLKQIWYRYYFENKISTLQDWVLNAPFAFCFCLFFKSKLYQIIQFFMHLTFLCYENRMYL